MSRLRNSAEGGTDAVTVTVGNSGGASGDAFDQVTLGTGSDIEYDTAQKAHGSVSLLLQPASSQTAFVRHSFTADGTAMASFYVRLSATPAAEMVICQIRNATTGTADVRVRTTRALRVYESGSVLAHSFATALSVDTWYRVELRAIKGTTTSNGTIECAFYLGDSHTPVDTAYSSAVRNTGTDDMTNIRYGRTVGVADTNNHWIDSIQTLSGTDANALDKIWQLDKIVLTATRLSSTSVELTWTDPGDTPAGVSIARAAGTQVNDGNGRAPSHVDYDPLTIAGASLIAEAVDETLETYTDSGLTSGVYTYWIVRTGA